MDNFQKHYALKRIDALVDDLIHIALDSVPMRDSDLFLYIDRRITPEDTQLCGRNSRAQTLWRRELIQHSTDLKDKIMFCTERVDVPGELAKLRDMKFRGETP
jgi:hypothetical protein